MDSWEQILKAYGYTGNALELLQAYFEKQDYVDTTAKFTQKLLDNILSDLREHKTAQPNFRLLSKKIMDDYVRRGNWSRLDLITKQILESIGLRGRKDWFHNFKIQNLDQSNIYELDFFLPDHSLDIENDGDMWHAIGDAKAKDIRRDKWLKRMGIKILRLRGIEFPTQNDDKTVWKKKVSIIQEKILRKLTAKNGESELLLKLTVTNVANGKKIEVASRIGIKKGKRVSIRVFDAIISDLSEKVLDKLEELY